MTKEDRERELNGINESRIKLGELAGQLGSYIGGGGKVSEAIGKAKECLEKQLKECENSKNHHASHDCQNDPNCQSIKEQKDKLESQKSAINGKQNTPNDLLNNLCTGLEKFLGFSSDSKGYNGQGIVYSDLDRLCDGMMAFLSGVLSNIQSLLGQHKGEIQPAINILNANKHGGKIGFDIAIGEVVKGVRGYNDGVMKSNDSVKTVITKMSENMAHLKTEVSQILNDNVAAGNSDKVREAVSLVNGDLQACKKYVDIFVTLMNKNKHNIIDLNNDCRINVDHANKNIAHETKRLYALSDKAMKDREAMIEQIESTLAELEKNVIRKIESDVSALVGQLRDIIKKIRNDLNNINNKLVEYVNELSKWMIDTKNFIVDAQKEVNKILNEFDAEKGEKRKAIEDVATRLEEWSKLLNDHINYTKDEINDKLADTKDKVSELENWKGTATGVIFNAEVMCADILKRVSTAYTNDAKIHNCATKLKTRAESLLQSYNATYEKIRNLIKQVQTQARKLQTGVILDLEAMRGKFRNAVSKYFKGLERSVTVGGTKIETEEMLRQKLQEAHQQKDSSDFTDIIIDAVTVVIPKMKENVSTKVSEVITDCVKNFSGNMKNFDERSKAVDTALTSVQREALEAFKPDTHVDKEGLGKVDAKTKEVAEFLSTIQKELQTIDGLVEHKSSNIVRSGATKGIKDLLNDLKTSGLNGTGETWNVNGENKKGLNRIQQDIHTALTDVEARLAEFNVKESLTNLENWSTIITQNFHNLISNISKTVQYVSHYMSDLKDRKIDSSIKSIRYRIEILRSEALANVIRDANTFIDIDAESLCESTITNLKSYVNYEVLTSTSTLTTLARKQYVSSVKHLLTAFAQKVTEELAPLPGEIDRDLQIGFKGMMKTLEDGTTKKEDTSKRNINLLKEVFTPDPQSAEQKKEAFKKLSEKFQKFFWPLKGYLKTEIDRLHKEEDKKKQLPETDETVYTAKLGEINVLFNDLLSHLQETNRYDWQVPGKLDKLSQVITELKPESFDRPNSPLLDSVTRGLGAFVGELNKVYISAYDSQTFAGDLANHIKTVADTREVVKIYELTEEGTNCGKIFLSIVSMLYHELYPLFYRCCKKWKDYKINGGNNKNELRDYLQIQGYVIDNLRNNYAGREVSVCCNVGFKNHDEFDKDARDFESLEKYITHYEGKGVISKLFIYLNDYYHVGHYATLFSKKRPCNIFEMLCWLSGLPCTSSYLSMLDGAISDLFEDPSKQMKETGEDFDFTMEDVTDEPLPAYPAYLSYDKTRNAVTDICSNAYDLLITIVGTGNAHTMYASDFSNNSLGFHYPTSGEDCLGMFMDLLSRLMPPLQFMYSRCKLSVQHGGWQECEYGKNIKTTKWPCKEHIGDKVTCQANCQPNDKPKCQPTSPLMSYLNDCLPGHLPHQLSSIGCKYDCATCPSTSRKGQPCITPLGFRGFSGRTKTGKDLCAMLSKIIDNKHLASLFCLVTKPPKTLPEHFGFALSLVADWHKGNVVVKKGVQEDFENSAKELSIRLCDEPGNLTGALVDAYGSDSVKHSTCSHPHLRHLASNDFCNKHPCAPYLSSLYADCYKYIANKNAKLYLYWAVYLPWDLWTLLNNLYTAFCGIACQDWGCNSCMRGDKCKKGKHGEEKSPCQCKSIVTCNGVSPTLYQYGFIFNNAEELNRSGYQKTCNNFCAILSKILKSDYFTKLFDKCDEFLFTIRAPFIWLNVALWSLSLFYLICVMVGRLDVLHIKSHLRSPSSHRITAQSPLAAAQVGRLAKISYLQP